MDQALYTEERRNSAPTASPDHHTKRGLPVILLICLSFLLTACGDTSLVFNDSLRLNPDAKSDAVHFNAEGCRRLATRRHDLLQDNGTL